MTPLNEQPGLRPAALPPTLQPHAVLALAPPTDRLRSAALSAAVYTLLAGGLVLLARAGVAAIGPVPIPHGPTVVIAAMPAQPVAAQPHAIAPKLPSLTGPVKAAPPSQTIPDTPASMPTQDQSSQPPAPVAPAAPNAATAPAGPMTISIDGLRILQQVDPVYPPMAKMAHVQGTVVLRMTIDADGLPASVQAVSGPPMLQASAMQAARQWRFQPATQNGQAVPATFLLTLNFVLR